MLWIALHFPQLRRQALSRGHALPEPEREALARFSARLELPAPVMQAENALFAARRLLAQMEGFLAARQAGVRGFCLDLLHDAPPATQIRVGLAGPGRSAEHFARLLRERLGALVLNSPVEAIRLEAGELENLPEKNSSLFDVPRGGGEEWLRLVERLQARLGNTAVHGLGVREDHRPERAFCHVIFGTVNLNQNEERKAGKERKDEKPGPRPLWLIDPPRRLAGGDWFLHGFFA